MIRAADMIAFATAHSDAALRSDLQFTVADAWHSSSQEYDTDHAQNLFSMAHTSASIEAVRFITSCNWNLD